MGAYKIAIFLELNLAEYITNIKDLQMLVDRLPSQQYLAVLNSVT